MEYPDAITEQELATLIELEFEIKCDPETIVAYRHISEHQDFMDKLHWAVANGLIEKPDYEY